MQATWVPFLGWEDPLEKGMATHSIIVAWRIPWTVFPHIARVCVSVCPSLPLPRQIMLSFCF